MGQYVLLLVVALTVGAVVFGVTVLVSGGDPGLDAAEPDGRSVPLPSTRPLAEADVAAVRFDTAVRGYRMAQVDQALRRAAYDIGYKDELISVLEAEITALRQGRLEDADVLREAREASLAPTDGQAGRSEPAVPVDAESAEPSESAEPAAESSESAEPAAESSESAEPAAESSESAEPAEPAADTEPDDAAAPAEEPVPVDAPAEPAQPQTATADHR